ncbi:sugar kinase [Devosia sp. A8/3-2]|nr:sugar kinase [Devosia sp. A8/3-2]
MRAIRSIPLGICGPCWARIGRSIISPASGEDRYSDDIRAFLNEHDIGTSHIRTVPGRRPGLYMIHRDKGDRHFTYWRDTSAAKLLADDKEALHKQLDGASMVYFSGITPAILAPCARGRLLGAVVKARDAGAKIVFDTNLRPALWTSPRVMASVLTAAATLCDIVLPTHTDEAPLFGDKSVEETAERYLELGVEEVVVKDGAGEALIATASERVKVAPKPGAKVVDATGAGDSFNGAYLSADCREVIARSRRSRASRGRRGDRAEGGFG